MHKYFLLVALMWIATVASAQNAAVIKGRVVDSVSNKPVEFATVVVSDARDTTANFISYTLSDKNGNFALHKIPAATPLKVLISFVAYQPFRKWVTLNNNQSIDLGNILLSAKQLNEVIVKGERMPITIRKDTIEFNAEAFKVRPNAVVEDLLKKLPGVEVDNGGKITVMGKDVTKIMVDGKEFFANDPRIASKNLDADMIAKVQVYDDRENDPDHLVPDIDVKKIINLKFKKALKKSIFGKIYGGSGSNDHYQASGLINMFRDTLQVSLLGLSNNLNSTGFDFNDLYTLGGTNRGGEAISRGGFGFGRPNGKQTTTSGGVNINTDYGPKFKVNLSYLFNHVTNEFNTLNNTQQFVNDTTVKTNSTNNNISTNNTHTVSGTLLWKRDDKTSLRYAPYLYISEINSSGNYSSNSFSNYADRINNSANSNFSKNNRYQFQQNLNYNRQLKTKGASFNIDHSLSINPGSGYNLINQDLVSYVAKLPSFSFRRRGDNDSKSNSANVSATYRYPVTKKLTLDISALTDYSNNLDKVSTYDYNPVTGQYDSFLLLQSSDLTRSKYTGSLNPGATYTFKNGLNIVGHLLTQVQHINNKFGRGADDLQQDYFNVLPNVNVNYKSFSVGYNRNMTLPNVGDLIPYSVVFSPIYSVTGNPDLKPTRRNTFSAGYRKFNFQSGSNYYFNANYTIEENSVFRQRTLSADLVETSRPINRDGKYSYNLMASYNKRVKKTKDVQFSSNTNASFFYSRDFYVLNRQDGFQNTYSTNFTQRFSLNWKDIVLLDPEYTLTYISTNYSGANNNNQNYVQHNAYTHFTLLWPQKYTIEGTHTYRYNPLAPAGFQKNSNLLNLSVARQFLKKDRAEIKVSCYDLLNQNISLSRSISANTISDIETQTIKRYFLLTLLFKFNKSTVKETAKPAGPIMIMPRGNEE